jgi:hypothetical protein
MAAAWSRHRALIVFALWNAVTLMGTWSAELNGSFYDPLPVINPIHSSIHYSIFDCDPLNSEVPNLPDDAPAIPPAVLPSVNLEAGILNAASVTTLPSSSSALGTPSSYAQEVQGLVGVCQDFLNQVQHGGAPWVVQRLNRLNHIYGPIPTDPTYFSYWMAMVGAPLDAGWRMT